MALRDDVERIRRDTLAALDRAHDFFTFTQGSWRILQNRISRRGQRFALRNLSTNSTVDQGDFFAKAQQYVAEELAEATLQRCTSVFEGCLSDIVRSWLLAFPEALSGSELTLTGREILALSDVDGLVDRLVAKELDKLLYDRPAEWFAYLKRRIGISKPNDLDIEQYAEIKATRDILVHGRGIVNKRYVEKASKAARAGVGERLTVPEPYLQRSWDAMRRMVDEIGQEAAAKF